MNAIITELKNKGIKKAQLTVNTNQLPAHNLYKSFGFQVVRIDKQQRMGNGEYVDEFVMEKRLAGNPATTRKLKQWCAGIVPRTAYFLLIYAKAAGADADPFVGFWGFPSRVSANSCPNLSAQMLRFQVALTRMLIRVDLHADFVGEQHGQQAFHHLLLLAVPFSPLPPLTNTRGTTSTPACWIASAKRFITCWVTWYCGPP